MKTFWVVKEEIGFISDMIHFPGVHHLNYSIYNLVVLTLIYTHVDFATPEKISSSAWESFIVSFVEAMGYR